jgi:flagellin
VSCEDLSPLGLAVPITIGSNISSLQAQRRLSEGTTALSKTFERLSSGLRISRASDDAAGLAVSEDLNLKSRVYTQGIRNGNDGLSLLGIADSAIGNLHGVVTRIRELASQAANGSYSNAQRQALDGEAQLLAKEFSRISRSTRFNGISLFDGTLGNGARLQLGFGTEGSIAARIGGSVGTGSFGSGGSFNAEGYSTSAASLGDLNNDGILDLVTVGYDGNEAEGTIRLGDGSGGFGAASLFRPGLGIASFFTSVALSDVNGDGNLDIVAGGSTSIGPFSGAVTVQLGTGTGTFGAATKIADSLD